MLCWICNKEQATESHHVYPVHLGGPTDGHQINICGNCHSFTHQSALRIYGHKPLDAKYQAWYDQYARGRKATALIVKAMTDAETSDLGDSLVPISFKVPRSLRDMMHIRKQDIGETSLNSYIIKLMVYDMGGNAADLDRILKAIKEG